MFKLCKLSSANMPLYSLLQNLLSWFSSFEAAMWNDGMKRRSGTREEQTLKRKKKKGRDEDGCRLVENIMMHKGRCVTLILLKLISHFSATAELVFQTGSETFKLKTQCGSMDVV